MYLDRYVPKYGIPHMFTCSFSLRIAMCCHFLNIEFQKHNMLRACSHGYYQTPGGVKTIGQRIPSGNITRMYMEPKAVGQSLHTSKWSEHVSSCWDFYRHIFVDVYHGAVRCGGTSELGGHRFPAGCPSPVELVPSWCRDDQWWSRINHDEPATSINHYQQVPAVAICHVRQPSNIINQNW